MPPTSPNQSTNNIPIRLSISEAARLFGITEKTIRRAIKNQEIRYIVIHNRYKLQFESLLSWSQKRKRVQNKMNSRGIGQYVDKWKIKNRLYSPNPDHLRNDDNKKA